MEHNKRFAIYLFIFYLCCTFSWWENPLTLKQEETLISALCCSGIGLPPCKYKVGQIDHHRLRVCQFELYYFTGHWSLMFKIERGFRKCIILVSCTSKGLSTLNYSNNSLVIRGKTMFENRCFRNEH